MPIRITGLNSGLDTESIISALVSSYNYKTQKYQKAQTKLSWKQDAWKSLNTKVYSFYSSISNLRYSSAYNLKSTTVSDTTKATVKASTSAPNGTQSLNIISVAQAGYLTGGKLASGTSTSTTLAELGYTGGDGTIDVTMGDGTTKSISVTQSTTVGSFISSLKNAGLSANFDSTNMRIYVSSSKTGADNDFTLTGSNTDGVSALYALGLSVDSDATQATYDTYTKYYDADGNQLTQNVVDAINAYKTAQETYNTKSAQNSNLTAAYGYASAYAAMQSALSGLSSGDQERMKTLLTMTATQRTNTLMDEDGNVYSLYGTDTDANKIYKDDSGRLIKAVTTTDDDGNSTTVYYEVEEKTRGTGTYYTKYTDADGNEYLPNDDGTYVGTDGTTYTLNDDGNLEDSDGNVITDLTSEQVENTETYYEETTGTALTDVARSSDVLTELKTDSGLTDAQIKTLTSNISTVNTFESTTDSLDDSDTYSRASIAASIKAAYDDVIAAGGTATEATSAVTAITNTYATVISDNVDEMEDAQDVMDENSVLSSLAAMDETSDEYTTALEAFVAKVQAAKTNSDALSTNVNSDAKKVDGSDAEIKLNGVTYTGSSNAFTINGLTITAQQVTGDGDENAITISTDTDVQGIYDKIKDFLTQYNSLINEMTSLYNADSAKGYEPLTDDEKDAMSDTEIEKWETKIKDALLRRDDTLQSIMSSMTNAMAQSIEIDGKKYNLSTYGIQTLGYLNAAENEQYAYHIYGDEDDTATSGKTDKLLAAITNDPDTVLDVIKGVATNLYNAIDKKMKSTTLSSVYTVYNDKEMASEYSDYTDLITKWQEKLQEQEDYYYEKFSAMETALAKLNSQSSSLSGLLGS